MPNTLDPSEGYSIPSEQDTVNEMVENAGSLMESFVRDTNNDDIWDTAVVVIGIRFDMSETQIDSRDDPKGEAGENHQKITKLFIQYASRLIHRIPLIEVALIIEGKKRRESTTKSVHYVNWNSQKNCPPCGMKMMKWGIRMAYTALQ